MGSKERVDLWVMGRRPLCRATTPLQSSLLALPFRLSCLELFFIKEETSLPITLFVVELACLFIIDGAEVGCGVSLFVGPKTYNQLQEEPNQAQPHNKTS